MKAPWMKLLRFTLTILLCDIVMTIVYLYVAYDAKEWDGLDKSDDEGIVNKIVNRFYYSVNVSTAFGLGPINPKSNTLKMITIAQIYITLGIFLSKYNPLRL